MQPPNTIIKTIPIIQTVQNTFLLQLPDIKRTSKVAVLQSAASYIKDVEEEELSLFEELEAHKQHQKLLISKLRIMFALIRKTGVKAPREGSIMNV